MHHEHFLGADGRPGSRRRAHDRGHSVTLLTSHPEVIEEIRASRPRCLPTCGARPDRTFDDLEAAMAEEIGTGRYEVIVHAAAVSDYRVAGIFTQQDGKLADVSAAKVKSSHSELWLKLVPTPKLVDRIRSVWGFAGLLVKFKLEVGLSDAELLAVAEQARVHSAADLMVANTLEGLHEWAFVGAEVGDYRKVSRQELADYLLDRIETLGPRTSRPH